MSSIELDPRLRFESYVVGAANRLAAAAARRVADRPGTAYNPLFIYSASGLGKTHLAMAIGQHALQVQPNLNVVYDTLEHLMEGVLAAIEAGERDAFRDRLRDAQLLLLDDVQFLAGHRGAQEELLLAWDALSARGGQVVLASDRPPNEIDDLDRRLLSRFSGGLIADIAPPDYETRVAIIKRKVDERRQSLAPGVAEVLARVSFSNVRELQGGLNRIIAAQELEGGAVEAEEVWSVLGLTVERQSSEEFSGFLSEMASAVGDAVERLEPDQLLADAILRWEGEGYRTHRLEAALAESPDADKVREMIARFESDVERLSAIADELRSLDADASELARTDVLMNPDLVDHADALLGRVRERVRPLPQPPAGRGLAALDLPDTRIAVRAARAVCDAPGERYNPLFVCGPPGSGKRALLAAIAQELRARHPDLPLAFIGGDAFTAELIEALERNHVDGWRKRYRRARLLVVVGIDDLRRTERAQDELFHLFDGIARGGGQLVFSAERPPRALDGIEERLRTRLGGGLVVEIDAAARESAFNGSGSGPAGEETAFVSSTFAGAGPRPPDVEDDWFMSAEKVLWQWPYLEDWIVTELS